jgi:hypothetical protein
MTQIPSGTKFVGIASTVPTPENKSSQNNAFQEVYTLADIQESVLDLTTPPSDGDVLTYDTGAISWQPAGGGSDYTETIVDISSAQILAMGDTPVELLAAPTAGTYYEYYGFLEYSHNTTAYTFNDQIVIGNSSTYGGCYCHSSLITNSANRVFQFDSTPEGQEPQGVSLNVAYPIPTGEAVKIFTYNGNNPTLGDGTLRVKIYHKTITFGA